jgi:hypothetical protein
MFSTLVFISQKIGPRWSINAGIFSDVVKTKAAE